MFNEEETIRKVLDGNRKAFEALVKQYERLVFHVVNRIVTEKEDVEDICQEVFIKVYNGLSGFAFESKLSTWIARIAYLTAINYVKRYRKNPTTGLDNQPLPTDENPEKALMDTDVSAYMNRLIGQLPEHYRTVLTLYHLNEFSYQEIQEITDLPEGTIKSHLFRARKLLKEKLAFYLKSEV